MITNNNNLQKNISVFLIACVILLVKSTEAHSQSNNEKLIGHILAKERNSDSVYVKPINLSVLATTSLLRQARINTLEGDYYLHSRPQLAFRTGVNYYINASKKFSLNTGIQVDFVKTLFSVRVPGADLMSFYNRPNGTLIEVKDLKFKIGIPIEANFRLGDKAKNNWWASAGLHLNYSGFSPDETVLYGIADSNMRLKDVLYADVSSNNHGKLWPSYSLGLSKCIGLKCGNTIQIGIYVEYSDSRFLRTDYRIEIPGKPITKGIISVDGTCIGLSFQYCFTKPNKRIIYIEKNK